MLQKQRYSYRIPDPDPSRILILDARVKKTPDPGSESATLLILEHFFSGQTIIHVGFGTGRIRN